MQIPPNISYRNVEKTEALDALVHDQLAKLDEVCGHIMGCHIAIEKTHTHPDQGSPYRVRLDITVPPRHELAVTKSPDEGIQYISLETVIRDAFEAMRKQLVELVDRQQERVKHHPEQSMAGLVSKLFPSENYGFLKLSDGRDAFFHRGNVMNDDFDRLTVGTGVRFFLVEGPDGLQAQNVQIVNKPGVRTEKVDEPQVEVPRGW